MVWYKKERKNYNINKKKEVPNFLNSAAISHGLLI
jgi:hypothetical protein